MWKELTKKTRITIVTVIVTTVLLLTGLTYAYFTADPVSGNVDNTVILETTHNANIVVNYLNGNTIGIDKADLKESDKNSRLVSSMKVMSQKK